MHLLHSTHKQSLLRQRSACVLLNLLNSSPEGEPICKNGPPASFPVKWQLPSAYALCMTLTLGILESLPHDCCFHIPCSSSGQAVDWISDRLVSPSPVLLIRQGEQLTVSQGCWYHPSLMLTTRHRFVGHARPRESVSTRLLSSESCRQAASHYSDQMCVLGLQQRSQWTNARCSPPPPVWMRTSLTSCWKNSDFLSSPVDLG